MRRQPLVINAQARLQQILLSLDQPPLTEPQAQALAVYFDLLLRWNARMNLTSIRDEEGILSRHFVESIHCARLLPQGVESLLDYGSGGGFPGLPCAICRPEVRVTLAESQAKKATFLREVVRTLRLEANVFHGRVDAMAPSMRFDVVSLRAVDRMEEACSDAASRVNPGGRLAIVATRRSIARLVLKVENLVWGEPELLPGSDQAVLLFGKKPGR